MPIEFAQLRPLNDSLKGALTASRDLPTSTGGVEDKAAADEAAYEA
jgi:hypothetical protein